MLGRRDNIQLYLFYRYLYQYVIMTKYMNFINLLVHTFCDCGDCVHNYINYK